MERLTATKVKALLQRLKKLEVKPAIIVNGEKYYKVIRKLT